MQTNNLTPAQKRANLKDIHALSDYIAEMDNEIQTQYPQPNGTIFLHGEIITTRRYNEAINEYNEAVKLRNTYAKPVYKLKDKKPFVRPQRIREEKKQVEVIDCTPTWEGLLFGMLQIYTDCPNNRPALKGEFLRMAKAADLHNATVRG